MKFRKHTRTTYSIETEHGEVEVMFEPVEYPSDGMMAERVGDKLVVGYLSNESDDPGDSPFDSGDSNGNLYLLGKDRDSRNSIWNDDQEVYSALQVNGCGEPNIYQRFTPANATASTTLEELAQAKLKADWEATPPSERDEGTFEDYVESTLDSDLVASLYKQHWREIVGPYVVPVSYGYNGCSTSISPTIWDGDPDDLPDGVWVADKGAIENIESSCLPADIHIGWEGALSVEGSTLHAVVSKSGEGDLFDAGTEPGSWGRALAWVHERFGKPVESDLARAAERYATPTLQEVQDWCNGNIYGVCVEVFANQETDPTAEPDWQRISDDACWGHIGDDWALEALKEEFKSEVERQRKEN